MQKGFNQGATKFVVENAEAFGLLLYDTTTPVWLADGDAAARNMDRAEGVIYLLKNWDSLPEQIADNFKSTTLDAKQKLDAGDHVGGMEIYGELTVKLGSSALSGLKLSADIASALGKIRATISSKASSMAGDLPSGYTELKGVGADASSADLPEGFKRVVDPDGNIELASSDGRVYAVPSSDWPELAGALKDAANSSKAALKGEGKINYGMGSFNKEQTLAMGEAWVGPNYMTSSNGYLISKDGLRQFRPPSYKPKLEKYQANFEQRSIPKGKWGANGHVDLIE